VTLNVRWGALSPFPFVAKVIPRSSDSMFALVAVLLNWMFNTSCPLRSISPDVIPSAAVDGTCIRSTACLVVLKVVRPIGTSPVIRSIAGRQTLGRTGTGVACGSCTFRSTADRYYAPEAFCLVAPACEPPKFLSGSHLVSKQVAQLLDTALSKILA
jgi:hypothetical protein